MKHPLAPVIALITLVAIVAIAPGQEGPAPSTPAPTPLTPEQLLAQARERAIEQVLLSADSEDPFLRANAIETAQLLRDRVQPLVQLALEDESPVVRFTALMTVGQLKLTDMLASVQPQTRDDNASVRMAALFALHKCGQEVDLSPIAPMVISQDPPTRRNAIMILGMLGDPSAIPMIKEGVRRPLQKEHPAHHAIARVLAAEAIAKLAANEKGERFRELEAEALHALRAGLWSTEDEVRVMSLLILGRLNDRSQRPAIELFLQDPPIELQLAAADYLARTGTPGGVDLVINASRHSLPAARAQAATTLGLIHQPRATTTLVAMLDDSQEMVRLAAAAAILRRTGGAVAQGR